MIEWSNEQVKHWRQLHQAYTEDTESVKQHKDVDLRRLDVQHNLVDLLHSFLEGAITLKAFNTAFQQKTRDAWNVFHLRGMSGGLFLNKLVKLVPSEDTFGHLLRLMIRVPEETQNGRRQMQAFVRFLEGLISSSQVTRTQLQPARVPFFLSAWWHIQDPERWPIFYLDVRHGLLTEEKLWNETQDPIEAYFVFHSSFLALAQALSLSSWELEHLTTWTMRRIAQANERGKARASYPLSHHDSHILSQRQTCVLANRVGAKNRNEVADGSEQGVAHKDETMVSCRTHLQWLLATLGRKVGCRVWIASGDHNKVCQDERLGDLSMSALPMLADARFQPILRQIDVLWLLDEKVIAAYEIEQAYTDVSASLLRLYDLGALFPTREMHLCVVAPQDRFEKVRFELSRPTFREPGQRKQCALISEELLLQQEAHILRWASSPTVIEELICPINNGKQQ